MKGNIKLALFFVLLLVLSHLRGIPALHRRGRRPQQKQSLMVGAAELGHLPGVVTDHALRLIAALLLLVQDDQAHVFQRCAVAPRPPRKPAIRSARPLKSSATTFRTILNPPASSDSTMPTRPLSSWAVSPTRQSPRTRSPDVSVDCCNWLRKRRRHAVKRLDFRFRKQNTMRLFRRMVFFVRLGLYYA